MKYSIFTLIFTFIFSSAFAQKGDNYIKLSHKITTETKAITGFDKIDVSEDFVVYIRFSDKAEKVEIEANENLHDLIVVKKEGETLKIHTKSYSSRSYNGGGAEEKLVAYITAKSLSEIKGDEDVVIKLKDKLRTEDLKIHLNEDCTLKGELDVKNLTVVLDEDSVLDIEGSAKKMDVKANEDCMIKSFDFVVGDLVIELRDESEAKLTVNGNIDLDAREESNFHFRGKGKFVKKRLKGESKVKTW